MSIAEGHHSVVLAAMADGIGDLSFASEQWVTEAAATLAAAVAHHASRLQDLGAFAFCEVAHNPPAHLHVGGALAWHARFEGPTVRVATGELAAEECDLKIDGDHSIMSNLARLQYRGRDPAVVAAARERLMKLCNWRLRGALPQHAALGIVLGALHDEMAVRTLPRFVFMTPEWVSSARHILTERASSAKYAPGIQDVVYTFSEEFTETPAYAFPDGSHGGFWVHVNHGHITVGAGPAPAERQPVDALTKGPYGRVVPVGRTVEAALTDAEKEQKDAYAKMAFAPPPGSKDFPVSQTSPSGRGAMPKELMRVFAVLHDELSLRTSGELPADYDESQDADWAQPQSFDRAADYDASWVRYDAFDIYGTPR